MYHLRQTVCNKKRLGGPAGLSRAMPWAACEHVKHTVADKKRGGKTWRGSLPPPWMWP